MSDNAYRLSLTAADIENLLLSIPFKMGTADIVYDYKEGGGKGKIAAASAVKDMWLQLNTMVTGEGLKAAINSAGDSNVFTDYHKSALERRSWFFVGSPFDIVARGDINTTSFEGGEVILLQHNESGLPEFQYWKRNTLDEKDGQYTFEWAPVYPSTSQDVDVVFPDVGTNLLKNIPKTLFHMVEFRIHAYHPLSGNWQSVDGKLGYKETKLLVSLYNELETDRIIEYSFDQDQDSMKINITTLLENTKCWVSIISGH